MRGEQRGLFGQDIKACYSDVSLLDALIRQTGLDHYVFGASSSYYNVIDDNSWSDATGQTNQFPLFVNLVNRSSEVLQSILVGIYIDDELVESQGGENADGSSIALGQMMGFQIDPQYLTQILDTNAILEISVQVTSLDGISHEIPGRLRIPADSGVRPGFAHDIHISGNSADGFTVMQ